MQWREHGWPRGISALLGLVVMAACAGGVARGQALPEGYTAQKDIVYGRVDGKELKLDVYYRPVREGEDRAAAAALVRFGATRETPGGAALELLKQNVVLVYAAYLPEGTGGAGDISFSKFPQDLHAAKAAVRWIRGNAGKYIVDGEKVGVWGSGDGASIAALVGMTGKQPELAGTIGEFVSERSDVRAMCLFEGVTDWRYAELYGDESVNVPKSPAYQLFGGNPKEHADAARKASAVNYVRPTSPATLMVTLSSDQQRAMHLIFAETLRKAGVRSALYEEPIGAARGGGGVDEARLNKTVLEFFKDTLQSDVPRTQPTLEQEIDQLAKAGLARQARRLIEEQIMALPEGDADATAKARAPWLKMLREINDRQQEPALRRLLEARRAMAVPEGGPKLLWTIREVLTDPERIGQYSVESSLPQRSFDARADALKYAETLNTYILRGEIAAADRQAGMMRELARNAEADGAVLTEYANRYAAIRGNTSRVWPQGLRGVPYASDYGQDLYGHWMDVKAGGVTQRFRYIPPGRFVRGSAKEEWGRLPGEPILEPAQISRGFWLADSEVTQGLWEGVMGREENRAVFRVSGANAEVRQRLPIENISYAHAVNFLNKLGIDARLPTREEWEYACRAGSNYMYSGTGRLSDMAWFWDERRDSRGVAPTSSAPAVNARGEVDITILHELETDQSDLARLTHPVKQKLPNKWGLYDMQGNVWEWCSGSSPEKPRDYHVAKGGSWISIPQSLRAARDAWFPVEHQSWNVGMRICITAE